MITVKVKRNYTFKTMKKNFKLYTVDIEKNNYLLKYGQKVHSNFA